VLEELGAFLKARQCGITRLDCLLKHRHAPPTHCVLRLAAPAANAQHFAKLLGKRLATLSLPEPVRACELRSGSLVSRAPAAESLWQPGEHGGGVSAAAPELIEQLRARLGQDAVYGLRVLESHRPETAWATADLICSAGGAADRGGSARVRAPIPSSIPSPTPWPAHRRPVWLLPVPEGLAEHEGLPRRHGVLQLLEGPERIETGWWSGGDISRDYYVALDSRGVRLWVFRERTPPHGWFLQGVFG
jgi:protein ImuB